MGDHAIHALNQDNRDVQYDSDSESAPMTRDGRVVVMVAAISVVMIMSLTVAMALGVRLRRVLAMFVSVLMSVFATCVSVFALLGRAVRNLGCIHHGSRENSVTGSATCSSMPASMPLMCRSAAR
jgi:ABC-type transport system involved in cytochrome bd biosynthesis fused ATPase/permease subunit